MDIRDNDQIQHVSTLTYIWYYSASPPARYMKVHMLSNAQKISIRDAAINNIGGDITIINNYAYPGPETVSTRSYVTYRDHSLGWILAVSFKSFIPMVQLTFGNYYVHLVVLVA